MATIRNSEAGSSDAAIQETAGFQLDVDPVNQNPEPPFSVSLAGESLAALVGRTTPFSAQQMWGMARAGQVPHVRIGRRIFFQRNVLIDFVAAGGSPRTER